VASLVISLLFLVQGPAMAAHDTAPGTFVCDYQAGRRIAVNAPAHMTSYGDYVRLPNFEMVWWSPDLYRWDSTNRRWYLYDSRAPWLQKAATSAGLMTGMWSDVNTGMTYAGFYVFRNIAHPGTYAVMNHYYWPSGAHSHSQWSTTHFGASNCTLG
jgi:hypothetical protein